MKTVPNQTVSYVTPTGEIIKGTVIEPIGDGSSARLDITNGGEKEAYAIASFNDDKKTPNTFHAFTEPAKPAGRASGGKPTPASA